MIIDRIENAELPNNDPLNKGIVIYPENEQEKEILKKCLSNKSDVIKALINVKEIDLTLTMTIESPCGKFKICTLLKDDMSIWKDTASFSVEDSDYIWDNISFIEGVYQNNQNCLKQLSPFELENLTIIQQIIGKAKNLDWF